MKWKILYTDDVEEEVWAQDLNIVEGNLIAETSERMTVLIPLCNVRRVEKTK